MLALLFVLLPLSPNIQPVKASGTRYIRAESPVLLNQTCQRPAQRTLAFGQSEQVVTVDDLDPGFTRYGTPSYWHEASIGYNNHMWWTYNGYSSIDNYGVWKPSLTSSGTYAVYVFIPNNHASTKNAIYTIYHNGQSGTRWVRQYDFSDTWVLLGYFYFSTAGNEYVKLVDMTYESYATTQVGFDAARWVRREFNLPQYVNGIDVSHWQGTINWQEVSNAGFEFAFAKATEGTSFLDDKFKTNMDYGKNAGMLMGAYHFACPESNSAADEANYFVSQAGQYIELGYLRPALDLEKGGPELGKPKLSQWVREFMSTVKSKTGVEPILYTNVNYVENYLDDSIVNKYNVWIANWRTDLNPNTGGWSSWDFWQHTVGAKGSVPGIDAQVDWDRFNGDISKLQTFVIGSGDHIPPQVDAFDVNPRSVTLGQSFTISYSVSDNVGLAWVELWRTVDSNGQPDGSKWEKLSTKYISGTSYSGSFTDSPSSQGGYWYGIHVGDTAGNWVTEKVPISVTVTEYRTLTVYSSPSGATFTVDGSSHTTPWSQTYSKGASVSLVMPSTHSVGEAKYYWDRWSDGVTSQSRTVIMDTDLTLTAYYTGPYYQLTVTSSPITGIPFTLNGASKTTSWTEWLLQGSCTVEMPATYSGYTWSHWYEDGDTNRIRTFTLSSTKTLTAVYTTPARARLVVRGLDNCIYYRAYDSSLESWGSWASLPGATCDSPAAAVCQNELHIVVRGMDGHSLYHGYVNLTDLSFSSWTMLNGWTSSAPTLASNGTVLCLVVRGGDNRIYYRTYSFSPRGWGGWNVIPSGTTCDSPAAAMLGNDLHIVVRGMDQSSLWDIIVRCDGTIVRNWAKVSGATPSRPVLASSQSSNKLYLLVRGLDDRIYYIDYAGSTDSWGSWNALPGATIDGPGATVCNNKLYVAVRGSDGNSLWFWDGNSWTSISGATPSAPTLTS
jgi:GH25 family lysozyme M1 (1,4-beta-N-acetylmuramidase)